VVRRYGARAVVTEAEVESRLLAGVEGVASALPPSVGLYTWTAPLFSRYDSDNYRGKERGEGGGRG
jgi:hypothetical protein